MDRVVRAFPILEGKEARIRELAQEIKSRRLAEAGNFYRRHGATHESWHLQETPAGLWLIGVTELGATSPAAAGASYARSHEPYDTWLKGQIKDITGVDPDRVPLGPPTECIFDWSG